MPDPIDEQRLSPQEWLDVLRRDYLRTYVAAGGSTVKVVVANEGDRGDLREKIAGLAAAAGFRYAHVDASARRVHLVHQMMWEISAQIPWLDVADAVLRRALADDDRRLPAAGLLTIDAIAEANDQTQGEVRQDLRRLISSRVYKNYDLSREFRSAATRLCNAVYDTSSDVQREATDVIAWFNGTLQRVSALKRLGIFRKVTRNNARQLLYSLTSWLRSAGEPGLVVTVDISRYVLGRDAPPAAMPAYTKLAALDLNEVLRQFIDATDELHGAVLVFLTDERFLSDRDRGLSSYEALRLRLTDDVRDRNRPNPLAPMVDLRIPPRNHIAGHA